MQSQGPGLPKTKKRVLARRGVLWLGQTCNLRCYFCYFVNRIADGLGLQLEGHWEQAQD